MSFFVRMNQSESESHRALSGAHYFRYGASWVLMKPRDQTSRRGLNSHHHEQER